MKPTLIKMTNFDEHYFPSLVSNDDIEYFRNGQFCLPHEEQIRREYQERIAIERNDLQYRLSDLQRDFKLRLAMEMINQSERQKELHIQFKQDLYKEKIGKFRLPSYEQLRSRVQ